MIINLCNTNLFLFSIVLKLPSLASTGCCWGLFILKPTETEEGTYIINTIMQLNNIHEGLLRDE